MIENIFILMEKKDVTFFYLLFWTMKNDIWYSLYYIVASTSMILATTARLQYVLSSKAAMPSFYTAT